ncbi:translation elongation factor EF-G [Nonomuraea thailandensis]|uniref:Translation elongation factor EF-G n=1 Tax=Nonomuraea thailandensis TaxID=1188745 RepID=A0A9X2KB72_9ACTN|nr:hypothetical protein [Nonomuraea thailandensis]MCP2363641.1 translation elongation factor EF-G [Nonomuraea thailandensis]
MHSSYSGCPHHYASVTVDFEPWEDGFAAEFADRAVAEHAPALDELPTLRAALIEGMREELARRIPEIGLAAAVVVQRMAVTHDSSAASFRTAGRLAVREALERAYDRPPKRGRRR